MNNQISKIWKKDNTRHAPYFYLSLPFISYISSSYYFFSFKNQLYFINAVCVLSHFSHVRLFVTAWIVAYQAPVFMGFSMKEYWSGLLCPPLWDLPNPGIKPTSFTVFCIGRQVLYQ